MEKEFVPMDLSVKLKELGFDKPCLAMYFTDKFAVKLQGSNKAFEFVVNSEMSKTLCAAPLWQQAFDWFRENKNLFSVVDYYRQNGNPDKLYFYTIDVCEVGRETADKFQSYEEARYACLEKLIELTLTHPSE